MAPVFAAEDVTNGVTGTNPHLSNSAAVCGAFTAAAIIRQYGEQFPAASTRRKRKEAYDGSIIHFAEEARLRRANHSSPP